MNQPPPSNWAQYDREHGNAHPNNAHLSQQRSRKQMSRYNNGHNDNNNTVTGTGQSNNIMYVVHVPLLTSILFLLVVVG